MLALNGPPTGAATEIGASKLLTRPCSFTRSSSASRDTPILSLSSTLYIWVRVRPGCPARASVGAGAGGQHRAHSWDEAAQVPGGERGRDPCETPAGGPGPHRSGDPVGHGRGHT